MNPCRHCGAHLFYDEKDGSMCCDYGKVKVDPFPEPTPRLKELLEGDDRDSMVFKENIRAMNCALSFASLTVNHARPPWSRGNYNPTIVISGQSYYNIGPIQATPGATPRNLQVWVHDPDTAGAEFDVRAGHLKAFLPKSTPASVLNRLTQILCELQLELHEHNPYAQLFKHLCDVQHDPVARRLALSEKDLPDNSTRRYTSHNSPEIAVLFADEGEEHARRDIVLHHQGGGVRRMEDTHRAADPLFFVVLHSKGQPGWRLGMRTLHNKPLTPAKYYKYLLFKRTNRETGILDSTAHLRCKRVWQEWCCIMFQKIEHQRLKYLASKEGQKQLRAELYQNLVDSVGRGDAPGQLGKRVVLPSSFIGGPRHLNQMFQDAMAVVRAHGKPDLFITFTCNPTWQEIIDALEPGNTWRDQPELVSRVFSIKLKSLMHELTKDGIFGNSVAHFQVIEFQKRGLPHAHILLILCDDHKLRTVDDIDSCISAELPPAPEEFPAGWRRDQAVRLRNIVLSNLIHGPCGAEKPHAPCMYNKQGENVDVCQKHYPMDYNQETIWDENSTYPRYRRRKPDDGKHIAEHPPGSGRYITNQWVVPYSPYLCLRYNAHINVEACMSTKSCKYLYKYVTKGSDRAMARVADDSDVNEVKEFQDSRSIGASEGCWRMLELQMGTRHPSVQRLQVHLEDQQNVTFEEGQEASAANNDKARRTTLTEFFELNKGDYCGARKYGNYQERSNYAKALDTKYQDFPSEFVWTDSKTWKRAQRDTGRIGRLVALHPTAGDVYYLRMLLCHDHCKGKQSYQDLRTLNGILQPTYQSVCTELGLLEDDSEWDRALEEAAILKMCPSIRELFVAILLFCVPADPLALFCQHAHEWWDDFELELKKNSDYRHDPELLKRMVLLDIEDRLGVEGKTLDTYQLPSVSDAMRERCATTQARSVFSDLPRECRFQLEHDRVALQAEFDKRLHGEGLAQTGKYREAQRTFHDQVMQAVENPNIEQRCFFLDARGGTGKTYVENGLLAAVRLQFAGSIALAVAVSGIASTLLDKASTFHSRFKAPIVGLDSSTIFNVKRGTKEATILRRCVLIVWDEAPMGHRHLLEALDRTLRDICEDSRPFAGKVIVLCGDFRQVLPVVPRASRAGVVRACLKRSPLWHLFKSFTLHENMRVLANGSDERLREFDKFQLSVGNGELPRIAGTEDHIELPAELCMEIDDSDQESAMQSCKALIEWVFPNLSERHSDHTWLAERAIFAPKNDQVDLINEVCQDLLPGDHDTMCSADKVLDPEHAATFSTEFLNSLRASGMPPHRLRLKPGAIVMLLSKKGGLCNGTRLIYKGLRGHSLMECVVVSGQRKGQTVFIPRILTQPSDFRGQPCEWRRLQFPVRAAFGITINKGQGQTLAQAGIWLLDPVFAHGQLYVALSRVGHPDMIKFAIKHKRDLPPFATRNVVYKEVLQEVVEAYTEDDAPLFAAEPD